MSTLYGIPNCSTVKKARAWLDSHAQPVTFHDFKKAGLTRADVERWLEQQPLSVLINRKGTTWRALDEAQKAAADERDSAIELMLARPSLIKRPVLEHGGRVLVGFDETVYTGVFA